MAEHRSMHETQEVRRVRRWRTISEKRQIVELTLEPGASVAEVARAHGMNANQVFKWRRAYERGELSEPCSALLPVKVSAVSQSPSEPAMVQQAPVAAGSVHVEFPGIAMISIESGADCSVVREVIESLRK
jgi:transposase